MKCPKCGADMHRVQFQGTEVDRCSACQGLWFDIAEERDLKRVRGSEIIDVGHPVPRDDSDDKKTILCPRDSSPMLRMVVPGQSHIWYEACPVCHGTYFDAGEFRDFKAETFLDRLKSLFTPERS